MLDIKFILANPELVRRNSLARGSDADIDAIVSIHGDLAKKKKALEEAQAETNRNSESFKGADETERTRLRTRSMELKGIVTRLKEEVEYLELTLNSEMLRVPNMAAEGVPDGTDEGGNVVIREVGTPNRWPGFRLRDHVELCRILDLADFEAGTKVAGPKFYFLRNEGVLFELALVRFALDIATEHGFTPMTVPELVRDEMITASGFTPRGPETQVYSLHEGGLSLIGTSEIPIGAYFAGTTVPEEKLPIRIAGVSHCFRTEAGSGGRESKGLYRVHQFTKVELYQLAHPDRSEESHELMLAMEEEFFQRLGIPYRVMDMCKGDLGAPAAKKYDIEAWMPFIGSQGGYGEVTSTSNCTDFQARRLNAKFKPTDGGKPRLVHTLNGTAVAVTRTMIAILENFQNEDGSVDIPRALVPYVGKEKILPK